MGSSQPVAPPSTPSCRGGRRRSSGCSTSSTSGRLNRHRWFRGCSGTAAAKARGRGRENLCHSSRSSSDSAPGGTTEDRRPHSLAQKAHCKVSVDRHPASSRTAPNQKGAGATDYLSLWLEPKWLRSAQAEKLGCPWSEVVALRQRFGGFDKLISRAHGLPLPPSLSALIRGEDPQKTYWPFGLGIQIIILALRNNVHETWFREDFRGRHSGNQQRPEFPGVLHTKRPSPCPPRGGYEVSIRPCRTSREAWMPLERSRRTAAAARRL
jgi:hypothetical protein